MCFGFDAHGALQQAAAERGEGPDRRSLLRGFGAGVVGAAALAAAGPAAAAPPEHAKNPGRGRGRPVAPGRISIQMYTLRSITNGATVVDVLGTLSDYGYRRVELAGTYGYTARQMRGVLDDTGIYASSSHSGISNDEAGLQQKIEDAKTLGQHYIVVPYLNSGSAEQWHTWAQQMNEEAAVARAAGLRYGYHNHAHEFYRVLDDGTRAWDIFMAELDPSLVHLEVDLYWAVTGGILTGEATDATASEFAAQVIQESPLETRQYHVKDRDPNTMSERAFADVGTGFMDFPQIFGDHMAEEFIVENDQPDVDPLTTARVGYDYLRTVRADR